MNEQTITTEIQKIVVPVNQLKVIDEYTCIEANDYLKKIKDGQKRIKEYFDPLIQNAHKTHKALTTKRNEAERPFKAAEEYLKGEVARYYSEQQRKAREEAERLRQEQIKREEEERLTAAQQAEDAGDNELAQAIIEEEVYVPPPVVNAEAPKLNNVSFRETWKYEVVDLEALCKAVAAEVVPIQAIQANTVFLGQMARSLQSSMKYPGVRVYSEKNVAVRQ